MQIKQMIKDGFKWYAKETVESPACWYKKALNSECWSMQYEGQSDWVSIDDSPLNRHKELISIHDYEEGVITKIAAPHKAKWYGDTPKGTGYYDLIGRDSWFFWDHGQWNGVKELTDVEVLQLEKLEAVTYTKGELPPVGHECEVLSDGNSLQGFKLLFKGKETYTAEITSLESGEVSIVILILENLGGSEFLSKGSKESRDKFVREWKIYNGLANADTKTLNLLYHKGLLK